MRSLFSVFSVANAFAALGTLSDALRIPGFTAISGVQTKDSPFLRILKAVKVPGYQLVFSGGTCLEKNHQIIFRMSEDVDIKLIEKVSTTNLSRTKKKSGHQWH